jgi:hypothetical protein
MLDFDNLTNPQISADIVRLIHQIELKKPTAIYTTAHIDKLLGNLNNLLTKYCGIYPYDSKHMNFISKQYILYVTSGNEESNKNLIYAAISSFRRITKHKPHIIVCDLNDVSLLQYLNQLKINNDAEVEVAAINVYGATISKIIDKMIKPKRTCLIVVNCANTTFGTLNNIAKLADVAHAHKVPIHVNCTYMLGTHRLLPYENGMDSFVMDFSYIGGIKNFGILGIKKNLLDGYQLDKAIVELAPTIDQSKLDPISLQMATNAISALYANRVSRQAKQKKIRGVLMRAFKKTFNLISLMDWLKGTYQLDSIRRTFIVLAGPSDTTTSPAIPVCPNIISIVPLGFSTDELTEFNKLAIYSRPDVDIVSIYKTIFGELFKKAEKSLDILNNIYILSWSDKLTTQQAVNYVKKISSLTAV